MASRLTGQSIERVEDARLLTGQGRFVGGFDRVGLLHAAFVRSPVAHARLVSIDASRARQAPGVVAIFDGDDVAATMTGPMAVMGPPALKIAPYWPLARGKVRVVGDPVAIVIADSKAHAVDAANLVEVSYDSLAPVITFEHARDPSRPALWDETGTNVIYEDNTTYGKPFAEVAAGAAHVIRRRYTQHRYAHVPIEGRGAIADYSKFAQTLDYDMANKRPHSLKMSLSSMLGIPYPNVHARSGDIGGAFGSKGQTTREDIALGAAREAARSLDQVDRRPWREPASSRTRSRRERRHRGGRRRRRSRARLASCNGDRRRRVPDAALPGVDVRRHGARIVAQCAAARVLRVLDDDVDDQQGFVHRVPRAVDDRDRGARAIARRDRPRDRRRCHRHPPHQHGARPRINRRA